MIFKRFTAVILTFILALPLPSFANVGQRTPEQMLTLVDEYVEAVTSKQGGPVFLATGRDLYLAKAVAAQIAGLEPEDFNLFQFYLMDRYVKQPTQREQLFALNNILRGQIETELANSENLRNGPWHNVIVGSYTYGTWILLGGMLGWRMLLSRNTRAVDFVRSIRQREVSLANSSKAYRLAFKGVTNPLVLAGTAGAIGGGLEYLLQSRRTQRVDPAQIMMVVQAQLACHLSYQALEIEDKREELAKAEVFPAEEGKALLAKVASIKAQAKVLSAQFNRLDQIDVRDPIFQRTLGLMPQAKTWNQFRSALSEADNSGDGKCRQMSLIHMNLELDKTTAVIANLMPAEAEPAQEQHRTLSPRIPTLPEVPEVSIP